MSDIIAVDFRSKQATKIPQRTLNKILRYVELRESPGGFLTAVLSNDLQLAVALADAENLRALKPICQYVFNQVPASVWGDTQTVERHLKGEYLV